MTNSRMRSTHAGQGRPPAAAKACLEASRQRQEGVSMFALRRSRNRPTRALAILIALCTVALVAPGAFAVEPGEDADCRLIRGAETPDDPADDVEVCEVETYFHRGATPVGNLSATDVDDVPSFDENEPTASDPAVYAQLLGRLVGTGQQQNWPTFEGEFTGTIDTLHVTMYLTSELYQRLLSTYPLIFRLDVDGVPIMLYNPAAGEEQDVPMTRVDSTTSQIEFGITNLYDAMAFAGIDRSADATHTVRLSMAALYYGDGNSLYYFDSVDRPSGIHFNPDLATVPITKYDAVTGG